MVLLKSCLIYLTSNKECSMEYITAGESHGPVLTAIVSGVPAGLAISEKAINSDLARRQSGYGRGGRQAIEKDKVSVTSGVRFGHTIGSPVTLSVANRDWSNWTERMSVFGEPPQDLVREVTPRPGHADLLGVLKNDMDDCRNILERSSARETTMRVAAAGIAREFLAELGVEIYSYVVSIGDEIMELAVAALLQGVNVLLSGGEATGKNILADNLAWLFRRPVYTVSFHVNTDSSTLIGTDTFTGGEVRLRRGPVALAAQYGGFCILDEINMAKNDAVAVLHSALDYRRLIDVPGYECIPIHPAARFIATMNYGYAGTRELNEALVSRFTVIRMPTLEEAQLCELLRANVPEASDENIKRCTGLFLDLNAKAVNGEISTNSVDMRGMIAALHLMTDGMAPKDAIAVSITNKCFDEYEYALVRDVALTRFA